MRKWRHRAPWGTALAFTFLSLYVTMFVFGRDGGLVMSAFVFVACMVFGETPSPKPRKGAR